MKTQFIIQTGPDHDQQLTYRLLEQYINGMHVHMQKDYNYKTIPPMIVFKI